MLRMDDESLDVRAQAVSQFSCLFQSGSLTGDEVQDVVKALIENMAEAPKTETSRVHLKRLGMT